MAALAEIAVEAFMRFIARNNISAPLALHELVIPAFFTNKVVACFVVNSFSGRYFLAANFTFYCIHKALCYRVVKSPDPIKAVKIEDGERPPLFFFEIKIRDGFGSLVPFLVVLWAFGYFIYRNKNG